MKTFYKLLSSLFILNTYAQIPNFSWAKTSSAINKDITTDSLGNVYIVGDFAGTVDFNPSNLPADTFYLRTNTSYITNAFILKLNSMGNFLWAKQVGSFDWDNANTVVVDATGNIIVGGNFKSMVDFDPNPTSTYTLAASNTDGFVMKLNGAGDFIWAKNNVTSGLLDWTVDLATDPTGNIYLAGVFNSVADFDPSGATYTIQPVGPSNAYVQKLDANGDFIWAKGFVGTTTFSSNDKSQIFSLSLDASNNIYTFGQFYDIIDFDPDATTQFTLIGNEYPFVSKLDANGNFVWAKSFTGSTASGTPGKAVVDATGNVFVNSTFRGVMDFDPDPVNTFTLQSFGTGTSEDICIYKLNNTGTLNWVKQFGDLYQDNGSAIDLDNQGNIYATGVFQGTVDFNASPTATNNLVNPYGSGLEVFITKLDGNGNYIDARRIGGGGINNVNAVNVDTKNTPYFCGEYANSFGVVFDLDPGPTTQFTVTSYSAPNSSYAIKLGGAMSIGLNEILTTNNLSIYPNPTNSILNIELNNINSPETILITNVLGKVVLTEIATTINSTLNIQNLNSGIYFLQIGNTKAVKFIKE